MVHITDLFVYPIKSCQGIPVERAVITPTGLRYDRNWVIVGDSGRFITQRERPELALIKVAMTPDSVLKEDSFSLAGAALILRAPGMPELKVPLDAPGEALVPASVWAWSGLAADEGPAASEWLTTYLGTPARLVRYAGRPGDAEPAGPTRRHTDPTWTPDGTETAFADGFPYLMASQASLEDLNSHLGQAISMDRFRANILVAGDPLAPWEEDSWRILEVASAAAVGGAKFLCVKPCSRCTVPTIDQATAVRCAENEPTETLHQIRSGRVLGWSNPPPFKNSVFFGVNMVGTQGAGNAIAVGDELRVLSKSDVPLEPREA